MSAQWYVSNDGQQLGPYSGEDMVKFAQEGRLAAETMVWADGMAEWLPASQVEGLIPVAAVEEPAKPVLATTNWAPPGATRASSLATPAGAVSPYAPPVAGYSAPRIAPAGGDYPYFPQKPASFALWMWLFLGAMLAFVVVIALIIGMASKVDPSTQELPANVATGGMVGVMVALGVATVLNIWAMVYFYMVLYRAWKCLQYGGARTTPGAAVGKLFIPFYNLYWLFVAFNGLPEDWNRIMGSYQDLQMAPRLNHGLFLAFCICSLIAGPVALILMFPLMAQLCKGVNFFSYRRDPNASAGLSGFGGIKFG